MTQAPSGPTVRAAILTDVPAMFDIRTRVRDNALTLAQLADLGITEQALAQAIRSAPCAFVAECHGAIVGFAMIDASEASLFALFVDPSWEGRGIGRALLAEAERQLFAEAAIIRLETAAGTRAEAFYRRSSWQVDAV